MNLWTIKQNLNEWVKEYYKCILSLTILSNVNLLHSYFFSISTCSDCWHGMKHVNSTLGVNGNV
jgi:hypothetical protein